MAQILRDASGKKIGEIKDRGDKLVAFDANGRKVGHWVRSADITYDEHGSRVGSGNLLTMLL
jgi:hypothetical protein